MEDFSRQIADSRENVRKVSALSRGGALLDVGANIGEVAIQCSSLFKRVISVEANPRTFKVLVKRTRKVDNLSIVHAAAASRGGEKYFVSDPSLCSTGSTARAVRRERKGVKIWEIDTISFRSLIGLTVLPTLIKMDIEGGEYECLEDPQLKIPKRVYAAVVEFHAVQKHRVEIAKIVKRLGDQGLEADSYKIPERWSMITVTFERKRP